MEFLNRFKEARAARAAENAEKKKAQDKKLEVDSRAELKTLMDRVNEYAENTDERDRAQFADRLYSGLNTTRHDIKFKVLEGITPETPRAVQYMLNNIAADINLRQLNPQIEEIMQTYMDIIRQQLGSMRRLDLPTSLSPKSEAAAGSGAEVAGGQKEEQPAA